MDQIYVNSGLTYLNQKMTSGTFSVRLFTNNITPAHTTVLADLTQAAWGGYSPASVAAGDWVAFGVSGSQGFAIANPVSFLNSSGGAVTAYGYYFVDPGGTLLVAATRFDSAPVSKNNGESYLVFPTWGDFSEF